MTYEPSDPTIDSQIVSLQESGADTFFNICTAKFAAQAIRKLVAVNWRPTHYLNSTAASISATLVPAGVENSVGIVTSIYLKDINDPEFANADDGKWYLDS